MTGESVRILSWRFLKNGERIFDGMAKYSPHSMERSFLLRSSRTTYTASAIISRIFRANGQCFRCLVVADSVPVKACITPIREAMEILRVDGLSVNQT